MPKQICYNCGIELEDKDVTREHIPAKNLFEGYDEKYKVNRITVPACLKCNGQYSPTDEEFRNMIGIIAKRKENNKITEKSVRSILRKDPSGQRLAIGNFGKVSGVTFNEVPIENYHKKNFKGLFYHQYSRILTDDYELFVNIDENDWSDMTLGILGYLKELFNWNHSGHPDIMKYVIQPFRLGITNGGKQDLVPTDNENMFVGYMDYNNEHAALVIAVRKGYLEEIKTKKNGSAQHAVPPMLKKRHNNMNRTIKLILVFFLLVTQTSFGQTYNYPKCMSQADPDLKIVKVTRGDYSTTIDFECIFNDNSSKATSRFIFLCSPNTDGALYIKANSKIFKLTSTYGIGNANGITLAWRNRPVVFSATFEPIPKSVSQFDLIEGGATGSWHFYGVNLLSISNFVPEIKTLKSDAKMRESDTPLSNTIFTISAGTRIRVLSLVGGYYKVEYNGKEGFINELYFQNSSNSNNNAPSSNNSTSSNISLNDECDNIKYTPQSKKPDFNSFLAGVKYAVVFYEGKIRGHAPAYSALIEFLQNMGFESVEYFGEKYEQPSNLCEEVFVRIKFGYDLEKFYNIGMVITNKATGYYWEFSTSKIAKDGMYSDPKYNFGQALRDMYGYKKHDFNSNYTMKLAQKQTCWTENSLKSDIKSKGCDMLEGIYEDSGSASLGSKYSVAVKKIKGIYYLIYLSGAHNYDNWNEGEIKATLETTATPSFFKARWIMADKSENSDCYISFENGLMNVNISENKKNLFIKLFPSATDKLNTPSKVAGSGTGYAISSYGYIVTNHHVTNGANSIKVRGINGDFSKTYSAKVIIEDKNNDLSIIKIDDPNFTSLGIIPYVIANRASDVGSSVFVLGYPLRATMGDEVKLTNGIISSKSGFQGDVTSYQITAPVQPGNSGGPLFDDKGNIIGIINAKHLGAENASYAIKASYLLNLIDLMPSPPTLQTISTVSGKPLTEQIKVLKKFTYIIEIN